MYQKNELKCTIKKQKFARGLRASDLTKFSEILNSHSNTLNYSSKRTLNFSEFLLQTPSKFLWITPPNAQKNREEMQFYVEKALQQAQFNYIISTILNNIHIMYTIW